MGFEIKDGVLTKYTEENGVTDVIIPDGVKEIEYYAFRFCNNIESIFIPDSVEYIDISFFDDRVFFNEPLTNQIYGQYKNLRKIKVSENNKSYCDIDGVLFTKDKKTLLRCPNIESNCYAVPEGVTDIDLSAFWYCTHLTRIIIPESTKTICGIPFDECENLEEIKVHKNNKKYCDIDGVLFSKDKKTLIRCPVGKTGYYAVPDGVTTLDDGAFQSCNYIYDIIMPDSLKCINDSALCWCEGLSYIKIPESVTYIGMDAFALCCNLVDITIPDSVSYIGYESFDKCDNLKTVSLPSHLKDKINKVFPEHTEITYR